MRRDEQTLSEKLDGVVRKLTAVRLAFDMKGTNNVTILRAINTISTLKNQIAALSIEQTQPVKVKIKPLEWNEYEREGNIDEWDASDGFSGYYSIRVWSHYFILSFSDDDEKGKEFDDLLAAKAAAQQDYETRIRSALVNAQADADVVERWRPIETAPRDGTEFQAWTVSLDGTGGFWEPKCRFNPETEAFEIWGRTDYDMDGWDVFSVIATHWMPSPAAPLSSLRPAEVGSATETIGGDA